MTQHSMNLKRDKTPATSRSIGIDLGDRFSELCVLDENGDLVPTERVSRTTQANLQEYSARRCRRGSPLRRERIRAG